jgi:hypothetical protein
MRFRGLLPVAVLALVVLDPVAAALGAESAVDVRVPNQPAREGADWVIDVYWPYMDHFCVHTWSYCPSVDDVPWEEVAWGSFEFELSRTGGFYSKGAIPCTLSYGGQTYEVHALPLGECGDLPECYDHDLTASGVHTVVSPTDNCDFEFYLTSSYCDLRCGSIDCQPVGLLTGTLYLYAETTAAARASWSTIKSRY